MRGPIQMRAEGDAIFGDFAEVIQTENLEAPGIGQDCPRPRHETMQAAQAADGFDSGTQVEVISVAEEDLSSEFFENILRHGFHRPGSANGHEHWSFDLAMGCDQATGTGGSGTGVDLELNGHL